MHTRDDMFNTGNQSSISDTYTCSVSCPGLTRLEEPLTEALNDSFFNWINRKYNPETIKGDAPVPRKSHILELATIEFNNLVRRFVIERGSSFYVDLETFYGYVSLAANFELLVNYSDDEGGKTYRYQVTESIINEAVKTVIAIRESDEHI